MLIEAANLRLRWRGGRSALDSVSLSVAAGDVVCLLGPNGAGKTTFMRCLLGIHRHAEGRLCVDGNDPRCAPRRVLARAVAYVPQTAYVPFAYRVIDMVLMGRTPHMALVSPPTAADRAVADAALDLIGVAHLRDRRFHELSGGERQLVLIARALAQEARCLLMDEPAAHLDYGSQVRVLRVIKQLAAAGHAVIMATHLPNHAFLLGGRAALMQRGRLWGSGAVAEVCTEAALTWLYGTPVRVLEAPSADGAGVRVCAQTLTTPPAGAFAGRPPDPSASME